MRKYALWFFRQMSAVRGRLLLRIIAGLLQVALGLWLVWLCRRFIDVVIWRGDLIILYNGFHFYYFIYAP